MTVLDPPKSLWGSTPDPEIIINTIKRDRKLIFGMQHFMQYT